MAAGLGVFNNGISHEIEVFFGEIEVFVFLIADAAAWLLAKAEVVVRYGERVLPELHFSEFFVGLEQIHHFNGVVQGLLLIQFIGFYDDLTGIGAGFCI